MSVKDYKDENVWLVQGDCLERMKEIPDGSVDLVLTDPPLWNGTHPSKGNW